MRRDGDARRTANQPPRPIYRPIDRPTNRSNRPTALHYPPSTTGAQPLPCTDAATDTAVVTATGVRHPRVYPPSLCLFPSPSQSLYRSRSRTRASHPTCIHTHIRSRLRGPTITPPFGDAFVYVYVTGYHQSRGRDEEELRHDARQIRAH